jgi:hypothetical protein
MVVIGGAIMSHKILNRPLTLLAAIGGVLLTLWIAIGEDRGEGPRQYFAESR